MPMSKQVNEHHSLTMLWLNVADETDTLPEKATDKLMRRLVSGQVSEAPGDRSSEDLQHKSRATAAVVLGQPATSATDWRGSADLR